MANPLERPRIEIRKVVAVNPDHDACPRTMLVLGVSDTDKDGLIVSFPAYNAQIGVRFLDPDRSHTYFVSASFAVDFLLDRKPDAQTHVWLAEFEVGSHPGLGMLKCGAQPAPIEVRAQYLADTDADRAAAEQSFDTLPVEAGFDIGVLLVHGIGAQLSADTLAQWSSAVQRWMNVWFAAGTAHLATRFELAELRHWNTTIRLLPEWWSADEGYLERCQLAGLIVAQANARAPEASLVELIVQAEQLLREADHRKPTPEEDAGRAGVIRRNRETIRASALAGRASFATASLLDPGRSPNEPANAELRIDAIEADGYVQRSHWLLAEAHWAEVFRAPSFGAFARWAVQAGPIAFCYFFGTVVRRTGRPWFASAHYLVALAAIVAIVQLLLLVLMILAALPVPRLRTLLAAAERTLTGVLGDSYVFVTDDLQRRAVLERVRRDLRWLLARCRNVVIVAHSQGAAVTYHALNATVEGRSPELASVVTLGSGFQILEALAKSLNDPVVLRAGWAAIVGFICVLAGVWLIEPVGGAVGGGLVAIGALGLVYGGVKAAELQAGEPVAFPYMGGLKNWWDFYAAHDPVPFGPLSDREGHLYKPRQIHNRDSFLTDHNAYWENADEFVGPLARLLAEEVGFKPVAALLSDDDAVMRRAALARASRVRALRAARWVIAACTIALLAVQWGNLSDVLAWARTWLLARVGLAATSPSMPATSVWVPVLFPLVPLFAYLAVAAPLWKLWGERELAAVLRRDPAGAPVGWVALFVAAPTGVVAVSGYLLLAAHAAILAGAWIVATAAATAMLCRLHRRRLVAERE